MPGCGSWTDHKLPGDGPVVVDERLHRPGHVDDFRVAVDLRPDLAERFRIDVVPTLVVVEGRKVRKRIVDPNGCREIEGELAPWLRR